MNNRNAKVDARLQHEVKWQEAFVKLRSILLDLTLSEELKWGQPCYAFNGSNICLIHGFKEYCALLFMKGALLSDPDGVLITQTENVQSARQIRFTHVDDVVELEDTIRSYVQEAIEVEKSGIKVELKKTSDYLVPAEFQFYLDEMPELKSAFDSLTPGRQRAYLFYFASPKQSKTRQARVEKVLQDILAGKGLNDL